MLWHTTQVMPAWPVSCFSKSMSALSNWPLKNGAGSWQPAHQRDALTLPSRFMPTSRVSLTLAR